MNTSKRIGMLAVTILVCTFALVPAALAASWTDFGTAQFSGITWDRPFQVNVLDYTLTVSNNPTMTIGSHTYRITAIQSVYAVSGGSDGRFTAANGSGNTGWRWDSKSCGGGQISGWTGQGNNRLYAGQSKTFHFASLDPKNGIIAGYHISYIDGGNTVTGWWKQGVTAVTPGSVPEPAPILCLSVALVGFCAHARRRKNRL